jgi:hypothetical protein
MRELSTEERAALAAAWSDLRESIYLVVEADSVTFALAYLCGAARSLEGAARAAIRARGTIARSKRGQ